MATEFKFSPLWLLVRTNVLHSWRRLMAIRSQSRLLTGIIAFFVRDIWYWRSSCFTTG